MRQRRRLGLALSSAAAAGVACLAIATPAFATDPAGNNGTVKIDNNILDDNDRANRPHVPCDFQVRFFNFDLNQEAKITFTIHPPSSAERTVLYTETKVVSDDEAKGGQDEDAVFDYSAATWGLDKYKLQENQGYHVKLTIESDGVPGGVKHKVFWLQPCTTSTESPSPTPTPTESESPTSNPSSPGASLSGGAGGGNGENGGSLPLTGVAATSTALTGLALIGGGAALMVLRRRRDKITFTS